MAKAKPVTYDDLPKFNSHTEAKAYFEEKYGADNFEFVEELNDKFEGRFFLYKLILDPETYRKGIEIIKEKGYYNNQEFIDSMQRIKIMEDGTIHLE